MFGFKKKVRVKAATFYYNKTLLNLIATNKANYVIMGEGTIRDVVVGDLMKFTGDHISCIVKITNIGPRDCNRNCKVIVKLVKIVKGELEIKY